MGLFFLRITCLVQFSNLRKCSESVRREAPGHVMGLQAVSASTFPDEPDEASRA